MSQLRSNDRRNLPGAGLVACFLLAACGATPVPNGSGSTSKGGGNGGGVSLLGGSSGSTTTVTGAQTETTPTESDNCGSQTQKTTRGLADVLLVLDMSGSMREAAVGGGTRYDNLTSALDEVLPATNSAINWGLMMYPGVSTTTTTSRTGRTTRTVSSGCDPGTVVVEVKENNASAVVDYYNGVSPASGHTPTAKSITNAQNALQQLDDGNPKFIVLATDGLPNCPEAATTTASDAPASAAAVAAAAKAGIPVFVVGMSITGQDAAAARDALNQMATAGGKAASDGDIKYYAADTSDQLVSAMTTIGKQIASCLFKLPSVPPVPNNVLVVYDDHRALPSATTWGYTDASNTSITIYGSDCEKVMDGTYKSVQLLYGCPGETLLIP